MLRSGGVAAGSSIVQFVGIVMGYTPLPKWYALFNLLIVSVFFNACRGIGNYVIIFPICITFIFQTRPSMKPLPQAGGAVASGKPQMAGPFMDWTTGSPSVSTLESLISFLGQTVAHRPQLSHLV